MTKNDARHSIEKNPKYFVDVACAEGSKQSGALRSRVLRRAVNSSKSGIVGINNSLGDDLFERIGVEGLVLGNEVTQIN